MSPAPVLQRQRACMVALRPPRWAVGPARRVAAVVAVALVLCSGCWRDLAVKEYPKDPLVAASVERWRVPVRDELVAHDVALETNLDLALVVMACESQGGRAHPNLYQITQETWRSVMPDRPVADRDDPDANIQAMAKLVSSRAGSRGRAAPSPTVGVRPEGAPVLALAHRMNGARGERSRVVAPERGPYKGPQRRQRCSGKTPAPMLWSGVRSHTGM